MVFVVGAHAFAFAAQALDGVGDDQVAGVEGVEQVAGGPFFELFEAGEYFEQ